MPSEKHWCFRPATPELTKKLKERREKIYKDFLSIGIRRKVTKSEVINAILQEYFDKKK